jgi:hypothetical protein
MVVTGSNFTNFGIIDSEMTTLTGDLTPTQPPMAESELSKADLHKEFRTIIMLLVLIAGFNHGDPVFKLQNTDERPTIGSFDNDQAKRNMALNAVAAILVRDTEVVAATIRDLSRPNDTGIGIIAALQGSSSGASSENNLEDVGLDDLTANGCEC